METSMRPVNKIASIGISHGPGENFCAGDGRVSPPEHVLTKERLTALNLEAAEKKRLRKEKNAKRRERRRLAKEQKG